jgi:hypothetical protein
MSQYELSTLVQKSFKHLDGIYDDGFQKYITNFQNLTSKAQITNERILCDYFSVGLDNQLTTMILSMSSLPTTLTKWIKQAKTFHTQKMYILALMGGRVPSSSFPPSLRSHRDPDAMMLTLSPFRNSPPLNMPSVSEKAAASTAKRLATKPPIVTPLKIPPRSLSLTPRPSALLTPMFISMLPPEIFISH